MRSPIPCVQMVEAVCGVEASHEKKIYSCQPSSMFLSRPKCGTPKQVCHIKMVKRPTWNTLVWNPIQCASNLCRSKAASSRWLCQCGTRWHSCPEHNGPGFHCGSATLRKVPNSDLTNKRAAPMPLLALVENRAPKRQGGGRSAQIDTSLHSNKRTAPVPSPPWVCKVRKLPPVLAARFPHLHACNQGTPFQGTSASSSSAAPPRQTDPG